MIDFGLFVLLLLSLFSLMISIYSVNKRKKGLKKLEEEINFLIENAEYREKHRFDK